MPFRCTTGKRATTAPTDGTGQNPIPVENNPPEEQPVDPPPVTGALPALNKFTLYPDSVPSKYIESNKNSTDSYTMQAVAACRKLVAQPLSFVIGGYSNELPRLDTYLKAARDKNETPQIYFYFIPVRDNGQYSSGGAYTFNSATFGNKGGIPNKLDSNGKSVPIGSPGGAIPDGNKYKWLVDQVCMRVGNDRALIMFEPDGLALSVGTNQLAPDGNGELLSDLKIRCIKYGVQQSRAACPNSVVVVDAGNASFAGANSASRIGNKLAQIGMTNPHGVVINWANYRTNAECHQFVKDLNAYVRTQVPNGLKYLIDTSRNGIGPGLKTPVRNYNSASVSGTRLTLPSSNGGFRSTDIKKGIKLTGAGAGNSVWQSAKIKTYISATEVTLDSSAPISVSGKALQVLPDDRDGWCNSVPVGSGFLPKYYRNGGADGQANCIGFVWAQTPGVTNGTWRVQTQTDQPPNNNPKIGNPWPEGMIMLVNNATPALP